MEQFVERRGAEGAIAANLKAIADVDPTTAIPEVNQTDNTFPPAARHSRSS